MATVNTASIDSLLDATLDDLADIPEFKPFPIGAHSVKIAFDYKEVGGVAAVELALTAVATVELATPTDTPITAGDTTNVLFMLKKKDGSNNDLAQGQLKELLKPLAAHFGTISPRATMAAANGAEVVVITDIREDKRDPQNIKQYTSIKQLTVL